MPTSYIVTAGEYSEYHVCGVYSTRKKADYAATLYNPEHREINLVPGGYCDSLAVQRPSLGSLPTVRRC